ncbi:MAG: insulinase family protein [Chitinophagaceae bacterium]|nr:insulinase family protein [Chitinophagaceae bacterium]
MKRQWLLLACFMIFQMIMNGQAKLVEKVTRTGSELVIPYEKYVLPNGLTVVVHEDHSDPLVHVDVTYHVGSAREEIGKSGFAHFFEHMMFQGSDHVADEQHFKLVSGAGGTLNGSTNRDRTNYFETVPSNQLEKMLWLEADRMGFLLDAVTQKKFEIQRSTVKNERGQNYDNRPYGLSGETSSRNLYPYGHPYSWLTIGYVEDLNRVDVNDLKNFFLRWYGPNNATLTVGGDVKPADVVRLAEKYFGSIPRGPEVKPVVVPPAILTSDRYVSYTDNYAKLPLLSIVYPTVPNYHPDMAALACLSQVLGQGKNSVLYQLPVKKQLALNASSFSQLSELAGEFSFQFVPGPGRSLAAMDSLFYNALDSFEARGVTDDDIAKFKGGMEAQTINGLQSVAGKVSQLAAFQTFAGNPNKVTDLLKMYQALTKEDVMRVYNKYIKGKYAVHLSILPKGQEKMIAKADNYKIDSSSYTAPDYGYKGLKYAKATDKFDRSRIPGNGPNPTVKVPKFWRKDLPGGVKVIGSESNEIPTVTVTIKLVGGHLLQATDTSKLGLASVFSSMMNEDTKNYTAEQMAVELQKLGSSVNVSSGQDGISFSIQSLKKNLAATMALVEERMLHPKFTAAAFSRIQRQRLENFKQTKSDPAAVASLVFAKLNFGPNNILGMSEGGTENTIRNLKLQDVQNYYDNYMSSNGAKVVIVGDVKQDEVIPQLDFLKKLPNKKIDLPKPANDPSNIDKTKVFIVDIPKAAQSQFRVGYNTGQKFDATGEFYKSSLVNYPLGGDFNSRLNLNLREDKGWTYGARSSFAADDYSGNFEFSSGIRADATDSALAEVMKELNNYTANGITEAELTFMKSSLGQRDALRYETGIQKAGFIGRILEYNLPANYVEQQNKILAELTKAQADASIKKNLNPAKMNILLVGDKAKIYDGVKKLGYEVIELDADGNPVQKKGF